VAYSFALVRSVKLDEIELSVEKALNRALKLKFNATLKQSALSYLRNFFTKIFSSKKNELAFNNPRAELAHLYNLRYNLTSESRVLESPSFLWEKPNYAHQIYNKTCRYLYIPSRVEIVQKKMDLPASFWTLENEQFTSNVGWRLEKMIIWLIAIEIFFQILEKSEYFQDFSWEKLLNLPRPQKNEKNEKSSHPFGNDYEFIEEKIQFVNPQSK